MLTLQGDSHRSFEIHIYIYIYIYRCELTVIKMTVIKKAVFNFTKNELLRRHFSRILVTDHGTNIVRNINFTAQPFLSKTLAGCL